MATPQSNAVPLLAGWEFETKAINGLVQGSAWQFSGTHQLTYSLDVSGYGGAWTSAWSGAVAQALSAWATVADLNVSQAPSNGYYYQSKADISVSLTGNYLQGHFFASALGIFPDPAFAEQVLGYLNMTRASYAKPEGDVFFDDGYYNYQHLTPGSEGFETILHELGHSLGLKHPFDDGDNYRPTYAQLGISAYDTGRWTIMSYNTSGNEATPMPLDILAIQRIYGANLAYHVGDDTYALSMGAPLRAIWDAGGVDTLDLSALTQGMTVRLGAGGGVFDAWSGDCQVAIAYHVTLENVIGTPYADDIQGNDADNVLDSGGRNWWDPAERLEGGQGNDTYVLHDATDQVIEQPGEGADLARAGFDCTLPDNVENLELTGSLDLDGTGNALDNHITGNAGQNVLDGGAGADTLAGGAGSDVYVLDNAADTVLEHPGEGEDGVQAAFSYTLADTLEHLQLLGGENLSGTGNGLNNILLGNSGNNLLTGLAGDDLLDGATGADTLIGGLGNDAYLLDHAGDSVVELAGEGVDSVSASFSYTLPDVLENLQLLGVANLAGVGNAGDNALIGNQGNNTLTGLGGDDRLDGGAGSDTLYGGAGNDTYVVEYADDSIVEATGDGIDTVEAKVSWTLGAELEHLTLTGWGNLDATGNALDNILTGNSHDNVLDGAAGADSLRGGDGADTYVVDAGDLVEEPVWGGYDAVVADFDYTLGENLEKLALLGSANLHGSGNALDNLLVGNAGDNRLTGLAGNDSLDGGTGADTLTGGAGDDSYTVDAGDTIIELPGEGSDQVRAGFDYVLPDAIEKLILLDGGDYTGTGNATANTLVGNSGANTLTGLAGDDSLDGGAGADTLAGGDGNDTYVVDTTGDSVTEQAGEGTDTIRSTVTWTLGPNLENLQLNLVGYGALDGTGNALDNALLGNLDVNHLQGGDGNDTLNGNGGGDHLTGGPGDDLYIAWDWADQFIEQPGEGRDTVRSLTVTTLPDQVEDLELAGGAYQSGTGNTQDNRLTGSEWDNWLYGEAGNDTLLGQDGNDRLHGGAGADSMLGGPGDDFYEVDDAGDQAIENADAGHETVHASIDWALAANLEDLALLGGAGQATGNELDNVLRGNAGDNLLSGAGGNDSLNGWGDGGPAEGGADTLVGGPGDDLYTVNSGLETIIEAAEEGTDTLRSRVSWILDAHTENLELVDFFGGTLNGTGNGLDNRITGNSYDNTLGGLDGNDTLDGGWGFDMLLGGPGDDLYLTDQWDTVFELPGAGTDTVRVVHNFTLGPDLENVELVGGYLGVTLFGNAGDNRMTGNTADDVLWGQAGNDTLDGGGGDDHLLGGAGHDTYVVRDLAASISESANEGTDSVQAWLSWTLAAQLENLTLLGDADLAGTGNALANVITGNGGANTLDGGAGGDSLAGGDGDDTYLIDHGGDTLVENANAGHDRIYSGVGHTLAANLEDLYLTGSADLAGTGNGLDNLLLGNAGNNLLQGGAGNDTLEGGAGNDSLEGGAGQDRLTGGPGDDRYVIDDPDDVMVEAAQGGIDTVATYFDFTLAAHFEHLVLLGDANGLGNRFDNTLTGGDGANHLDGGRGWDRLAGGAGDDSYRVDQTSDLVSEAGNAGTDEVQARVSYALAANLETLILADAAGNLAGTGNALANLLTGNGGHNTLDGGDGNDTLAGLGGDDVLKGGNGNDQLSGGLGQDWLAGGAGNDRFVFDTSPAIGGNADLIADFVKGQDQLVLSLTHYAGIGSVGFGMDTAAFRAGIGVTALDADDHVLYDTASGALFYDPDGSGFDPALLITSLTGSLAAADILVLA